MGGKVSAEYYRAYRKAHPELQKRYNELRRQRRATKGREDRTKEYQQRAVTLQRRRGDGGQLLESCIVTKAKALAAQRKKPDRRTVLWDDRYEDLVGECVLALCEGRDPGNAMHTFLKKEWEHTWHRAYSIS